MEELEIQDNMGGGAEGMQNLCFPRNCKGLLRLQALLWAVLMADVEKGPVDLDFYLREKQETASSTMRWGYNFWVLFMCRSCVKSFMITTTATTSYNNL